MKQYNSKMYFIVDKTLQYNSSNELVTLAQFKTLTNI